MTIEALDISVIRGRTRLLDGVSLSLRAGELTALIGPNGAGKSTLMACLAGGMTPDRGTVRLDGRTLAEFEPDELARRRAVLGQNTAAPGAMILEELVALGRMPYRRSSLRRQDLSIVAGAMEQMSVTHLVGRACCTLSGGELQRGHLARTAAQIWKDDGGTGAGFLFLDEPTASLDPAFQWHVLCEARKLADQGFGVLLILHDFNQAALTADRIVLLNRGSIVAAGPPDQVLTVELIAQVYGIEMVRITHPQTGCPTLLPAATGPGQTKMRHRETSHA